MNTTASSTPVHAEHHPLLRLLHWAMLWSPLRDDALGEDAWQSLSLPGRYADIASAFNQFFVIDLPAPRACLMFNVTLQREAGACREECMRIAEHLGMDRTGPSLPPDHVALACEMLAHSLQQQEQVLSAGIIERYLLPWIDAVTACCDHAELQKMLARFREDVREAGTITHH